jgi:hypothetical protein
VLSRPVTRCQQGIIQKKVCTHGTIAWNTFLAKRATSLDTVEPHDYRVALRVPHWHDAMEKEFSALQANGTWNLVPSVPSVNLIDSK